MTSEGLFNVYVERPRSDAPDAAAKLARAMADHYGIDATAIQQRLGIGRFRVKGNVDRATADSFAADLTRLGAIVNVVRADEATPPPPATPSGAAPAGKGVKRNRTPPTGVKIPSPVSLQQPRVAPPAAKPAVPAVKPVTPVPTRPTPVPVAKPAAPAPRPAEPAARPSQPQYASGLAAAAAAKPSTDDGGFGALGGDLPLSLSTLDGEDDHELSASRNVGLPASFGPPPDVSALPPPRASAPSAASSADDIDVSMDDDDDAGDIDMSDALQPTSDRSLPASMGPAMASRDLGSSPPASRDLGGTNDMFAPPDAQEEIALALDVEPPRKKASAAPPVMAAEAPAGGPTPPSGAAPARVSTQQPAVRAAPGEPAWRTYGKDERVRFVAGVVVAAALGCVPALVAHSVRQRSAFAEIDSRLEQQQAQVLTRSDWDNLDRVRASFVEKKKSEQQSIAITSMLVWAAVSGAVAFVWFRKIDWDRIFR